MTEKDWDNDPDRTAYHVWICGRCDSHLSDCSNGDHLCGDHLCEDCGDRYDHRGQLISEEDGGPR